MEKHSSYTLLWAFSFHRDKIKILKFRMLNFCMARFSKIRLRAFVLDASGIQKYFLRDAKTSLSVINFSSKMQNLSCECRNFPTRCKKFPAGACIKIFFRMTSIKPTPTILDPCYLSLEILIFWLDRNINENNTWQKVQMPVPPPVPVTGTSSKGRCLQVNVFFKESVPVRVTGILW